MNIDSSEETSDPLIGATWAGRYAIRSLVARGSMGRVYKAEQLALGRQVAIKVLDISGLGSGPSFSAGDRHQQRFLREASILARMNHPSTVRVFDFGVEGRDSYLVMEFVEGQTLRVLTQNNALKAVRAVRIARQICGSLEEAHSLGVVHRDLKPANILVSRATDGSDLVKVVDFGLVKEVGATMEMTGEGMVVGTPMFMSPEQIRGAEVDGRCDLYALGIVLYRMLTGRYPFEQGHQTAVLMSHLTDAPLPFAKAAAKYALSPRLEAVVMRCLAKRPEDRFLNAGELQRALRLIEAELLDDASLMTRWTVVGGKVVVHSEAAGSRSSRSLLLLGALSVAGVLGLVVAAVIGFGAVQFGYWFRSPAVVADAPAPVELIAEPEPQPVTDIAPPPAPNVAEKPRNIRPAPAAPRPVSPLPPAPPPVTAPAVPGTDLRDPFAP